MRSCDVEKNRFVLSFSYVPDLVAGIKELPSYARSWNPKTKEWSVSLDVSNPDDVARRLAEYLDDNQFTLTDEAESALGEYVPLNGHTSPQNGSYDASMASDSELEVEGLLMPLRPFQRAGVEYLINHRKSFLADEMGLGKTVQSIAAVHHLGAKPCLISCPASLQINWVRELQKWLGPDVSVSMIPDRESEYMVIPYTRLKKYWDVLTTMKFESMICDESHYLKNAKAQRTKSVRKLAKKIPVVYLLSGTPVINRPSELISQLQILQRLEEFGGWTTFAYEYCAAYKDRFGLNLSGAKNLRTLNDELRKRCYVRRAKKDVLNELPDKQRITVDTPMTDKTAYLAAEKVVLRKIDEIVEKYEDKSVNLNAMISQVDLDCAKILSLEELALSDPKPIREITRCVSRDELSEVACSMLMRKADNVANAQALMLLNELKKTCALGKLDSVFEWVDNFLFSLEKLIVFAESIEIQNALIERFAEYSPCAVLGEMDVVERQRNVDAFQSDPERKLIVCSLQAAGLGLTLTAASNVAFVQCGWTPAVHDQAEDRAHRIGQDNAVNCYYLLSPDSIDGDVWDLIESKREVVDRTSDGGGVDRSGVRSIMEKVKARAGE